MAKFVGTFTIGLSIVITSNLVFVISDGIPLPLGVVDCGLSENQQDCSNCAGEGWYSKTTRYECTDAIQICLDQGYDGNIKEYGGNWDTQCEYVNNQQNYYECGHDSDLHHFGYTVSWNCGERATTERTTTSEIVSTFTTTTQTYRTTTESSSYSCMDITVDDCSEENVNVIDSLSMDTLEDCKKLCGDVFKEDCLSFVYHEDTKMCTVLKDDFRYVYGCDSIGSGHDTVQNCLTDDEKYPDQCKKMLESECVYTGDVILEESGVWTPEECFELSELLHGDYYVHKASKKLCKVYGSNERTCKVQRGTADNMPSECPK